MRLIAVRQTLQNFWFPARDELTKFDTILTSPHATKWIVARYEDQAPVSRE